MSFGWGSGGGSIRMSGYGRDDDSDEDDNEAEASPAPVTTSVVGKNKQPSLEQKIHQSSVKAREDSTPKAKPAVSFLAQSETSIRVASIDSEDELRKSASKKHGSLSLSQKLYDSQENLLPSGKVDSSTEQLGQQQLLSQDQIAAFMKSGRGHLIPPLTPIEDIMGAIAGEYRWTPDELSSDLAAITKYRIRNAKAARALSEAGWLEMKNLLPVTKDLVRHAVGWSASSSLAQ
ncbi:hypothetical protein HDU81_010340 [Chytriomyces hyalinus]|nr:hypothetical protein HDU81_010340 [Chytriomyces hyalinus]